jgi:hypothetical protein
MSLPQKWSILSVVRGRRRGAGLTPGRGGDYVSSLPTSVEAMTGKLTRRGAITQLPAVPASVEATGIDLCLEWHFRRRGKDLRRRVGQRLEPTHERVRPTTLDHTSGVR